jgi:hypothetical protein
VTHPVHRHALHGRNTYVKKLLLTAATAALGITMITVGATANADEVRPSAAPVKAIVGTFNVVDQETLKVKFTNKDDIERAKAVLAGDENPHPIGRIVYGKPDINAPWSWHLTEAHWADVSSEVCDGLPSDVEERKLTSPFFCPWGAKLVKIEEIR